MSLEIKETVCECGKKFICEHEMEIRPGIFSNHCIRCQACETCKGWCPTCFKQAEDWLKTEMDKEFGMP